MIRYILVDDEPKTLKRVKTKIDRIAKDYELKHIASYDSSKKAFQEINEDAYDLLIVDFEMPVYNGMELAQKIATNKKIVFLTATTDNEKRVINRLDISGYLSKPFDIEEFEDILKHKVIGKIETKKTYTKGNVFMLPVSKTKNIGIYPADIYIISSALISTGKQILNKTEIKAKKPEDNNVHLYGKDSEILFPDIRITISKLETLLKDLGFAKINQSTLVNINYIKNIDNRNLELYDCKEPLEISVKEKTLFLNIINGI
ncbi:LytR/AlgR family response regulator transcription factor [Lacinutrix cladophorae]